MYSKTNTSTKPNPTATNPRVLVVGAGAVGLATAYHLSLAGADLTLLVRTGKKDQTAAPKRLYCYDDAELKTFDGFRTIDDINEYDGQGFDFVLVTLDAISSRSPQGETLLRRLGDRVRNSETIVIMCAAGADIHQHYADTMKLPGERLLRGLFGMLSHQASADLPIHPPTDPALIAQADVCYKHPKNKQGFRIETRNPVAAKAFIDLYNRSGFSLCGQAGSNLFDLFAAIGFPAYAACDIAGWPGFSEVIADRKLWRLAIRAQNEIAALPRYGWTGKLSALMMTPKMMANVHLKMERDMMPLDLQAFNRFHHGGKVREQDIQSLRESLVDGLRAGRRMTALKKLLERTGTRTD